MEIRKLTVGPDYKDGMHYSVGQEVLGGSNKIHLIKREPETLSVEIWIINKLSEVVLWKEFTYSVPKSIEFNIDF